MEVLISKVTASLTRVCMIYLSIWSSSISEDVDDSCSDEQFIIQESKISNNNSDESEFGNIRTGEKKVYNLSMTLFNEVKKKADSKLILGDLNFRKKVKQL